MNNRDPNWQNYIYGREQAVFNNLAFDGWHIDTVGQHTGYDYSGVNFNLDDFNPQFINNAKTALGKRMTFNTVDAVGETRWPRGQCGFCLFRTVVGQLELFRLQATGG